MKSAATAALLALLPGLVLAIEPDCAGIDRWPTNMAFVQLKNSGVTDNEHVDFAKTKTVRLASEKIGDDLFRQIHHVTFTEKSGSTIELITMSDASHEECSMGPVTAYLVTRHFEPTLTPNTALEPTPKDGAAQRPR